MCFTSLSLVTNEQLGGLNVLCIEGVVLYSIFLENFIVFNHCLYNQVVSYF